MQWEPVMSRAALLQARTDKRKEQNTSEARRARRKARAESDALELAKQFSLLPPRTHAGDPVTSHQAEERMHKGQLLSKQLHAVLGLVDRWPGKNASELARYTGLGPMWKTGEYERKCQIRRRLSDLKRMGIIVSSRKKSDGEVRWWRAA